MKKLSAFPTANERELTHHQVPTAALSFPPSIPEPARAQLMRMFRDPNLLDRTDRAELVAQLEDAVALEPEVAELRVILGMALCVNYDAQSALEEFREACYLDPDSYIAQLKFGELLMRLRVCDQAAEHTQLAAELAVTPLQAELARRQAATLRTMQREGIERGGYGKFRNVFRRTRRWFGSKSEDQNPAALSTQ
ncbi:MAG: hypothetical protein WBY53_05095 [Acidobacteriaceae bacterium]